MARATRRILRYSWKVEEEEEEEEDEEYASTGEMTIYGHLILSFEDSRRRRNFVCNLKQGKRQTHT